MNDYTAPTNSSPEELEAELRDRKGPSETSLRGRTDAPPKTFQDILPPQLIATSTAVSEAGYMGYRKSKFKATRSSTFPRPEMDRTTRTVRQAKVADQPNTSKQHDYPTSTSRRSTLKKMKGMMHSIKRSISTLNDSKKTSRPPIPSSSAFTASKSQNRRLGRQTLRRQDGGYLDLSDGEDAVGDR